MKEKSVISDFDISCIFWMKICPIEEIHNDFARLIIEAFRAGRVSEISCKSCLRNKCEEEINSWFKFNQEME